MERRLKAYIDSLFEEAPAVEKIYELKEEMQNNLLEKYNDLISDGNSPEAAFNIAVTSVGDITSLIEEINREKKMMTSNTYSTMRYKYAILTSISVMILILSLIPLMLLQNEIGLILMFAIAAVGTVLIVFTSLTKPRYEKLDNTFVEEFKESKSAKEDRQVLQKSISSILWIITTVVYIVISFYTNAWHITWIIFLISAAIDNLIKVIWDYNSKNKK